VNAVEPSATRVRYAIVAVTTLAAILLYLDRICISFTAVYVREHLGLTNNDLAWVLGAFFVGYGLAQVPAGWLSDRYGARLMMTVYIVAWSLFTVVTGLATGLVSLLAARFAVGLAQAGAYPTAASLVGRWVPTRERGKANSIVSLGGRVGGVAAFLITPLVLVAFTPIDTSSLLEDADLLDVIKLCRQLQCGVDDSSARVTQRVLAALSRSGRTALDELAAHRPGEPLDPQWRETLLNDLNKILIQPDFCKGLDHAGLNLSSQAEHLLTIPSSELTPAQTMRLNRLVLEAACPGTIRQLYGRSWREVLFLYGGVGLLVGLLFWWIVRDRPAAHPWANKQEADLVSPGEASTPPPATTSIPWAALVRSRNMWLSGLLQFCVNLGWAFLITLLPRYLEEVFRVPIEERGRMAMVPLLAACVGSLPGGWLTDRLRKSIGLRWARALPLGITQFICVGVYLTCPFLPSAWAVIIALSVMALTIDVGLPALWSFTQDVGGRNVGATLGFGNMIGNFGAALSPIVLSNVQAVGGWSAAFVTCAIAFFIAGCAGLCLNATQPLQPEKS
jgi:sugar phosphate permease